MVAALRADVQIAIELGAIELCGAAGALDPKSLGHRVLTLLGADSGRHKLIEPTHIRFLPRVERIIAESPDAPLRLVLVPRQRELRSVQDLDERQALRRRSHAGLAPVPPLEDARRVLHAELAAANR